MGIALLGYVLVCEDVPGCDGDGDYCNTPSHSGDFGCAQFELGDAPACDAVIATLPYLFGLADGIANWAVAVRSPGGLLAVEAPSTVVGLLHAPSD